MELLILILMPLVVAGCALKLSFWKGWQATLFGLLCGTFVLRAVPWATQQSKTRLAALLADHDVVQNAAVFITIEAAICAAWCFVTLRKVPGGRSSLWGKVLQVWPGLLVFPVLFYLLAQCIYALPGVGFGAIGWVLASAVTVGLPALSLFAKWALSEAELRVEVYGLTSLLVCVLGLIATQDGMVAYAPVRQTIDWGILGLIMLFFIILFATGALWNGQKWARLQRKQSKNRQ